MMKEEQIMRSLQALLLHVAVFAIVVLVPCTIVLAGTTQCTSSDNNFKITVTAVHANGRSTYTYNLQKLANANPNKMFIYFKMGLKDPSTGDFKFKCAGGTFAQPNCTATYIPNGNTQLLTGGPISTVWADNRHNDGFQVTNVSIGTFPITIDVLEREPGREQDDETTILVPTGSTQVECGPIEGPMQAQKPFFEGSPLVTKTARLCFANGCCYNATSGKTDNIITSLTTASDTPNATVPPFEACAVVVQPGICEQETGLEFCPPVELGRPPIQGQPGGTCYFPANTKISC